MSLFNILPTKILGELLKKIPCTVKIKVVLFFAFVKLFVHGRESAVVTGSPFAETSFSANAVLFRNFIKHIQVNSVCIFYKAVSLCIHYYIPAEQFVFFFHTHW